MNTEVNNPAEYEVLRLRNQLCFPLYACSRETIKLYKPYLDEIDLTYTQYIAMLVLWERKTVTAKELGHCLFLDSGTLTPLLKRMEGKGLLERRRGRLCGSGRRTSPVRWPSTSISQRRRARPCTPFSISFCTTQASLEATSSRHWKTMKQYRKTVRQYHDTGKP